MKILVTGGAGYIGSAAVKSLVEKGFAVFVIDNLSKGKKELVDKKAKFYQGDLIDKDFVEGVFANDEFDAVMHFAAYKAAGESMEMPEKYSDNITGTINLLNAMSEHQVKKIIFSSTAAVYGLPEYLPIDEKHKVEPINFYGFTKLECERILNWYAKLRGIINITLRYFNVVGDAGLGYIDPQAENVVPRLMDTITGKSETFTIYGNDYKTPDGTGIRDYIGINDLVKAHLLALKLKDSEVINIGTSRGVSVLELIKALEKVSGRKIKYQIGARRAGDPDKLTASYDKAKNILGWKPQESIEDMLKSTYKAYIDK